MNKEGLKTVTHLFLRQFVRQGFSKCLMPELKNNGSQNAKMIESTMGINIK